MPRNKTQGTSTKTDPYTSAKAGQANKPPDTPEKYTHFGY